MKTKLAVVAAFQARPGKETALREALIGLLDPTRKESGCLGYELHQSPGDHAKLLMIESWENQAAIDAHMKSPHVQQLVPRVDELCVAFPQITVWEHVQS
jgi:quinol monooxygenase YgiN